MSDICIGFCLKFIYIASRYKCIIAWTHVLMRHPISLMGFHPHHSIPRSMQTSHSESDLSIPTAEQGKVIQSRQIDFIQMEL